MLRLIEGRPEVPEGGARLSLRFEAYGRTWEVIGTLDDFESQWSKRERLEMAIEGVRSALLAELDRGKIGRPLVTEAPSDVE